MQKKTISQSRTLVWALLLGLCALAAGLLADRVLPAAEQARELALAQVVQRMPERPAGDPGPDALGFCRAWSGLPESAMDCRTGLELATLAPARSAQAAQAWTEQLQAVRRELDRLGLLAERLEASPDAQRQRTLGVLFSLRQRLDVWDRQWQQLAQAQEAAPSANAYAQMFQLSLELRGQTYDAGSQRLRRINWHVARLADGEPAVVERARQLEQARAALPVLVGLLHAALLALGWWRARWRGACVMGALAMVTSLGLLMVADAAIRFGEGSAHFSLNPLGNQLARQMLVVGASTTLMALVALIAPSLGPVLYRVQQHWWLASAAMVVAMVAGYAALGPAMGAEMLKLGMGFLAGLLMAAHGRALYLSSQWAPQGLSPWRMLRCWRLQPGQAAAPVDLIAHELGRPVLQAAAYGATGLALAALAFHDLGAALVTALVAICMLFLVFGARITGAVVLSLGLVALALAQTQKVQQRLSLMLDPLSASVSDFARLVAFTGAASERGFAWGQMAWCNPGGVCVPLQSLSDYMPVILTGLLGWHWAALYFVAFMLLLVWLGRSMLREFLTRPGVTRVLAPVAFFLLVCTGAQTVITFLGNWRWIPLTGIGAPLLSIGLSSLLMPCLAFGLVLAVWSIRERAAPGPGGAA